VVDEGYDFEKMIEAAMQKYGETPAVQPPPSGQARVVGGAAGSSAVDPALGENYAEDQADKQNKKDDINKTDSKKKQLLMKRKNYDPRAAIKKTKKHSQQDPSV